MLRNREELQHGKKDKDRETQKQSGSYRSGVKEDDSRESDEVKWQIFRKK